MTVLILIGLVPVRRHRHLDRATCSHEDAMGPLMGGAMSLFALLGGSWFPLGRQHHRARSAAGPVVLDRAGRARRRRRPGLAGQGLAGHRGLDRWWSAALAARAYRGRHQAGLSRRPRLDAIMSIADLVGRVRASGCLTGPRVPGDTVAGRAGERLRHSAGAGGGWCSRRVPGLPAADRVAGCSRTPTASGPRWGCAVLALLRRLLRPCLPADPGSTAGSGATTLRWWLLTRRRVPFAHEDALRDAASTSRC